MYEGMNEQINEWTNEWGALVKSATQDVCSQNSDENKNDNGK